MAMWKAGTKVVCVDVSFPTPVIGVAPPLVKGKAYTIVGGRECPLCARKCVDVGIPGGGGIGRCHCGHRRMQEVWWVSAWRFRPLLGHEQEQLDGIEEEAMSEELLPA